MTSLKISWNFTKIFITHRNCDLTFGKLAFAFNSPDTAKKEMENFVNKLLWPNFYKIPQYFTHPIIS